MNNNIIKTATMNNDFSILETVADVKNLEQHCNIVIVKNGKVRLHTINAINHNEIFVESKNKMLTAEFNSLISSKKRIVIRIATIDLLNSKYFIRMLKYIVSYQNARLVSKNSKKYFGVHLRLDSSSRFKNDKSSAMIFCNTEFSNEMQILDNIFE